PLRGLLFPVEPVPRKHRASIGVWCSPGCDQHPQSSQPQTLGQDASPFISRTDTPPPCAASLCPLDTGGLIGVRPVFTSSIGFPVRRTWSPCRPPRSLK